MPVKEILRIKYKHFLAVGLFLQIAYILFSIYFFKERILYADTARFLAEIAGTGNFHFTNRLIVFFSSFMPVIGTQLGCSLKVVMILYSLNVALMYAIPFFIIAFVFRNIQMGLCLLLFQFIFPLRTHYLAISELQHGIIFLILFFSYVYHLNSKAKSVPKNPILLILLFAVMNAHPLILLAFCGSCIILSVDKRYWKIEDQKTLLILSIFFFLLSRLLFTIPYESNIISNALDSTISIDTYKIRLMISYILRQYYPTLIIGVISFYVLIRKYPASKIVLISGIFVVQVIFVYLRFYHISIVVTFFEIYLSVLAFLIFLVFAIHFDSITSEFKIATLIMLVVLLTIQSIRVIKHSNFYQIRLELYSSIFKQMKLKNSPKVVLPFFKKDPIEIINDSYTTPFETYILSFIDDDDENDSYIISYWLSDSVQINYFNNYASSFFRYSSDSISIFPFTDYPNFEFSDIPYTTFDVVYNNNQ